MSNEQFRKGFSAPLAGEVACNAIGGLKIIPLTRLATYFPRKGDRQNLQ